MKESKIDKIITDTPLWVVCLLYMVASVIFFGCLTAGVMIIVHHLKP